MRANELREELIPAAPLSRAALKARGLQPALAQSPAIVVWSEASGVNIELFDLDRCVMLDPLADTDSRADDSGC